MRKYYALLAAGSLLCSMFLMGCQKEIPSVETEKPKAETAAQLGLTEDMLDKYLASMQFSYSEFIAMLQNDNLTTEDAKKQIEDMYQCSFADYAELMIFDADVAAAPDDTEWVQVKSSSPNNVYFRIEDIDITKTGGILSDLDIEVKAVTEEADDDYIPFTAMGGDFVSYYESVQEGLGAISMEIEKPAVVRISTGKTKPEDTKNEMFDKMYVTGENGELCNEYSCSTVTIHFRNSAKDYALSYCPAAGCVFKAKDAETLQQLDTLLLQGRYDRNKPEGEENTEASAEAETLNETAADSVTEDTTEEPQ